MRSRHRAAVITAALTAAEQDADRRGWDARPALLGLFDTTCHRHAPGVGMRELPVDEAVWRLHEQTVPGLRLPYWVGLTAITEHLTAPNTAASLRQWARAEQRRLIGMAFLCEGLDTHADSTPAHPDGLPVRALIACDIDARHYQILRVRGAASTTTTVLDNPPASVRATVIPMCLQRLLTCVLA